MKSQIDFPSCENCTSRLRNVFCKLTQVQLTDMSAEKDSSTYKKGQVIFNEGNRPAGMFCVNKGKIKIYQTGEEGKEQILRLAKEGDIIGYRSLISGEHYSAGAAVMEDSVVCFIPKDTFMNFLQTNSDIATSMMQLLSHDLKDAETRLTALAQKPVRERMAESLLMLNEFYGINEEGQINASVSREDLANIVGTATETAIRILSEFKSEKLIELSGKKIKITDREKLIKAAHVYD